MSGVDDLLLGYFQLMNMNGAAHVYREAGRVGLLRELSAGRKTVSQLAEACRLIERPVQLLLDATVALGVAVAHDGGKYGLSQLGHMLTSGSYRNLGDEYWAHLPQYLATGQPIVKMDDVTQSEAHYQAQAAVLGWMLTPAAQVCARILSEKVPTHVNILDLGAGSAVWSLQLASSVSGAMVTANDWPAVLEVAQETAQQLNVADRLFLLPGNYHEVELPSAAFDLIFLANITHLETPEGNSRLLTKACAALKPGGRIAIIDVLPGQPQGDLNRTLYTLGLALRTEHGQVYSVAELSDFCTTSGLSKPEYIPLETPPYVMGLLLTS